MASGFVQRFKGKVAFAQITFPAGAPGIVVVSTVTGSTFTISPAELSALDGGGVSAISATTGSSVSGISSVGITLIPDTTFNSTYYLADPVPGGRKVFFMKSTVASSGTRSVATLTTGVAFYGSSMGTVTFDTLNFGSSKTIMAGVELLGISSTSWLLVAGGYNASTVTLSTSAVTLTTRT